MFNWIEEYIKAGSPKITTKQLALLARSRNPKVRLRVAENPKAQEEILAFLSEDTDHDVRIAVATGKHTPRYLVEKLARDHDPTVRHGLAEDLHTSPEILALLAEDDNGYVSCRARKTLQALRSTKQNAQHAYHWPNSNDQCFA